jgi:ABC-type antimicrobial peptide transport system permease subunit
MARFDDEDFAEEIRTHLAMAEHERVADGADPRSARLASLKDFGHVTLTTEAARGVWVPVSPTDLVSFANALAIVLGGVLVATLIPAWRAARTDPLRALRRQ